MREFWDWYKLEIIVTVIMAIVTGGAIWLGIVVSHDDSVARERFMSECLQYHKEFECVAMWRAGESRGSTIIMPMVVPSGR